MIRYSPEHRKNGPKFTSLKDVQILTLQGHPEFTNAISSLVVDAREANGAMDKATASLSRSRANWRNDGTGPIGKAIWGVLGVGP
jgi:hypothetical protein